MALTDQIISYWKFDENTGTTAGDSVGSNTGTLSTNGGSIPTWFTPALINSGLRFNGSNAYVNVPNDASLQPTAITVNAWVKASSFTNGYNAVMQMGDGTIYWEFFVKSDGKVAMYLIGLSSALSVNYDGTGSHTLSTGAWHMVTLTYDSTQGLIGYVDGTSDGSAAANGTLRAPTTALSIGRDGFTPGRYWPGDLDEIGIWSRALTSAEVSQLYNSGAGLQYPFSTAPFWQMVFK